jgi:hypothetical protein
MASAQRLASAFVANVRSAPRRATHSLAAPLIRRAERFISTT